MYRVCPRNDNLILHFSYLAPIIAQATQQTTFRYRFLSEAKQYMIDLRFSATPTNRINDVRMLEMIKYI